MTVAIVILAAIVTLFVVMFIFFNTAFVRKDDSLASDLNSPENEFLSPFKDVIQKGMDYIRNSEHTVETTKSFDGLKLVGNYYKSGNSKRTIIIFHGYRSSGIRDFSCAVRLYNELGLNVLLVDQRSHGRSEGKYITFGVNERKDVAAWINYVLKKCGSDCEIVLGGLSMGATTVMMAAGTSLPKNVTGIIADCGFTSPKEIIFKVAKTRYHVGGAILPLVVGIMNVYCRIFGRFNIYGLSTVDSLKKSHIPIIIIHGAADGFVPYWMSERNFEAANEPKKLITVKNADHGMSFLYDEKGVTAEITEFLNSIKRQGL